MSDDPLIRRLSQLSPNGAGLDRDALLFAAGRASARPNRRWMAMVGALTASQLLTLGGLLWPRDDPPVVDFVTSVAPIVAEETPLPPAIESPGLWLLRNRMIEAEGNLPMPVYTDELVPPDPPLRAFGPWPKELVN